MRANKTLKKIKRTSAFTKNYIKRNARESVMEDYFKTTEKSN